MKYFVPPRKEGTGRTVSYRIGHWYPYLGKLDKHGLCSCSRYVVSEVLLRQPYWTVEYIAREYSVNQEYLVARKQPSTSQCTWHKRDDKCTKTNYFECDRSAYKYQIR